MAQTTKVEKKTDPVVPPPNPDIINVPVGTSPTLPIGDKLIFWVYGLGGNVTSWDQASVYTETQYKITSLASGIDYSSYSLNNAGAVLRTTIDGLSNIYDDLNENENPGNSNFIIAHSQGGLVSRAAYKRYYDLNMVDERKFGGIVTFGTPHQGAQLLNNVPDIIAFTESSCSALTTAPALELWEGNWFASILIESETIENAVNTVCGLVGNTIVPVMMQDYLEPITEDYYVGAPYLDELNTFDSDMETNSDIAIAKVAFFGVEEDPIIWRLAYSLLNDVNAGSGFGASYDEDLIDVASQNQNATMLKYYGYRELYDNYSTGNAFLNAFENMGIAEVLTALTGLPINAANLIYSSIVFFGEVNNHDAVGEVRDAYLVAWVWWMNVEETYLSLIGAVEYIESSCHCDCLIKYGSDTTPFDYKFPADCGDPDCSFVQDNLPDNAIIHGCDYAVVYEAHIKPNDGIVLQESAQDYPGAGNGSGNLLSGSNHIQMRNDLNLYNSIGNLLNGNSGLYFTTEDR